MADFVQLNEGGFAIDNVSSYRFNKTDRTVTVFFKQGQNAHSTYYVEDPAEFVNALNGRPFNQHSETNPRKISGFPGQN